MIIYSLISLINWEKNQKKEYGKIFGMVFFWDHSNLSTVSSPNTCSRGNGDLSEKTDVEIPQKRQVLRDANPKTIIEKAAKVLKCNTNDFLQSSRISDSNKLNRDLLIYYLWSTG